MTAIHKEPYKRTLKEAERRGEEGAFWESYNDDCYCRMAIDNAIKRNYDGIHLSSVGILRVVREYGLDRVERILANKIRQEGKGGGFSKESREWAKTIPVPKCIFEGNDLWKEQVLSSDSHLVEKAVDAVRKERAWRMEQEKECSKQSIRMQLARMPVSVSAVNEPQSKYGREER